MTVDAVKHIADETAASIGTKMVGAGAVTAGGSGVAGKIAGQQLPTETALEVITLADIGIMVGIGLATLGYLTQLFFHWRRDRREQRLMNATLADIEAGKRAAGK